MKLSVIVTARMCKPSVARFLTHTLTPYEGNVGFDFLGYTVRQFHVGKTHTGKDTKGKPLGYKTINKPSKKAIKTHVQKTNHLLKRLKSVPQKAVIGKMNPVIKGWCNYHKVVCAKKIFHRCDSHLYQHVSQAGATLEAPAPAQQPENERAGSRVSEKYGGQHSLR